MKTTTNKSKIMYSTNNMSMNTFSTKNKAFSLLLTLVLLVASCCQMMAQTVTVTYTTPGSDYTFTVPCNATNVKGEAWGGGGGGGGAYYGGTGGNSSRAGGGGGGAYAVKNYGIGGATMTISVGNGGAAGTSNLTVGTGGDVKDGGAGGASSSLYNSVSLTANGGQGGQHSNYGWTGHSVQQPGAGGNGGTAEGGEAGSCSGTSGGSGDAGGYGGGGCNGGGNTGNVSDGNNGVNGNFVGGGGSGGRTGKPFFGGNQQGGAGAGGRVIITFALPVITITSNNPNLCIGDLLSVVDSCTDATYTWYKDGTSVATGATYTPTEAATYTVVATYNYSYSGGNPSIAGGSTTNPSNELVIKPTSVISAIEDTICNNETVIITPIDGVNGTVLAGTTYTWTVADAGEVFNTAAGSGSSFNSGQLVHHTTDMQTAIYQVIPTTDGCSGNSFNISVTLKPSDYYGFDTVTLCDNAFPFQYGTAIFPEGTVTGDYPVHFKPVVYCDSMVTLHIAVNPTYNDTVEIEACRYVPVTYFPVSFTPNRDTVVSYLYQSVLGCDSLVTLKVKTVYFITEQTVEICSNERYYFGNQYLVETGVYFDTLHTVALGCDSVIQLNLIVKPAYKFEEEATVYGNQIYSWQGHDYQNLPAGQHVLYENLTSMLGCDSIYQLTLTVFAQYETHLKDTTCFGIPYTQHGFNIMPTTTGLWLDTLTLRAQADCDSIIYLALWVNNSDTTHIADEICFGATYTQHGFNLVADEATTLYDTLIVQNRFGCDSVLLLALTVNPDFHSTYEEAICFGERFMRYGFDTLPENIGTLQLQQTLQSIKSCDSVITVTLTVNPVYAENYYDTICQGRGYNRYYFNYADTVFNMAGDFQAVQHLQTINGCDSVRTLYLHINPVYANLYDTLAICASELPLRTGNRILFSSNTYLVNYKTACDCDSTVWLTLRVYPHQTLIPAAVCVGEPYQLNGFNIPTDSTLTTGYKEYVQHLTGTVGGCDSTVILQLTVNQAYQETILTSICLGERFNEFGFDTIPATVGLVEMTQNLTAITGCDSVVTLQLTVNQSYLMEETVVICSGATPYTWHGQTCTQSGDYYDLLQTARHCDSIFILHLTVNNAYYDTVYVAVCGTETHTWRGQTYTQSGIYNDSFTTLSGCDSLYTLVLTINDVFVNIENVTICNNESYGWQNHTYTQSGRYSDTLHTIHGCDSIFILNLTVQPVYLFEEEAYSCNGVAYNWRGHTLTASGIYYDTLQTVSGCDSIYRLAFTVYAPMTSVLPVTICQGESYLWNGIPYTQSGEYTVTFHNGYCDSTATLILTVNPIPHTYIHANICQGQPYEGYGFTVEKEATATPGTFTLQQLVYTAICDSIVSLTLTVNPVSEVAISDSILRGQPYFDNGFNISIYQTQEVGEYHYQLATHNATGCDSVVNLTLFIISGTGIDEGNTGGQLTLYPNPTTGELRIINYELNERDNIEIYNMLGQKQFSILNSQHSTIDVSHLSAGMYMIKVGNYTGKFIKR